MTDQPLKMFMCDLNWTCYDRPFVHTPPSAPQDWAFIDAEDYFESHRAFSNNMAFYQGGAFVGATCSDLWRFVMSCTTAVFGVFGAFGVIDN